MLLRFTLISFFSIGKNKIVVLRSELFFQMVSKAITQKVESQPSKQAQKQESSQKGPELERIGFSPYTETVKKKLRSLSKKLAKIERYEALPSSKLDVDQKQLINRKSEVAYTINELTDLLSNMEAVDASQNKLKTEKLALLQKEEDKKLAAFRKEVTESIDNKYSALFDALYVANIIYSQYEGVSSVLSPDEFNALSSFSCIVRDGLIISNHPICTKEDYVNFFKGFVRPYAAISPKNFVSNLSFKTLHSSVSSIYKIICAEIDNIPNINDNNPSSDNNLHDNCSPPDDTSPLGNDHAVTSCKIINDAANTINCSSIHSQQLVSPPSSLPLQPPIDHRHAHPYQPKNNAAPGLGSQTHHPHYSNNKHNKQHPNNHPRANFSYTE